MQSGQNASFGLLPGGADFWISVVLVQARFDYRFFLFAKFPVIEPRFIIEFILLGPNFPPLFRIELGSSWPWKMAKRLPLSASQSRAVLSREAVSAPS